MLNAAGTQACGGYAAGLGVWRAGVRADPVTGTGPLPPWRGPGASAPEEEAPEGGACPRKPGHGAQPWDFRRCGPARGLSPRPQSSAARPGQPDVAASLQLCGDAARELGACSGGAGVSVRRTPQSPRVSTRTGP